MIDIQQNNENIALHKFIVAARKYVTARDALWSLGLFDRIFRSWRCVDALNLYDEAKDNVRAAFQEVKDVTIAKTGADIVGKKEPPPKPCPILTVDEFEMLLNKPPILRSRGR